jgi:SAM-dependent methyltransferase
MGKKYTLIYRRIMTPHIKKHSPAFERNKYPILKVLRKYLPYNGTILEIASGPGEHAVFFTSHISSLFWLPSDPDPSNRHSIKAWKQENIHLNILEPLDILTEDPRWSAEKIDLPQPISGIICMNMVHIAPWSAAIGLMKGAARILKSGGILYLYGPYKENNIHTAVSNQKFDASLKEKNPQWGVKNLENVIKVALENNLILTHKIPMPNNNLSLIFKKTNNI